MAALIRKMHEARTHGASEVSIWGTGTPRREFLCSDDMADACVFLMENYDAKAIGEFVNIGVGEDITIRELAELVRRIVGFEGKLIFDISKPDGAPRKLLDVSRLSRLGWCAKTSLETSVKKVYEEYLKVIANKQ